MKDDRQVNEILHQGQIFEELAKRFLVEKQWELADMAMAEARCCRATAGQWLAEDEVRRLQALMVA